MKILVVCQHYWPEPFNVNDICEGLIERGHELTVLTGQPNYPEGMIYPGYEGCVINEEEHNGVTILRSKLHPRNTGPIHRVWNYYSFSYNASTLAKKLPGDFDVVYSFQTSPVMMANPAIAYSKKNNVPLLLHVVDIWPACLTAGGINDQGLIYRYFKAVSRSIYNSADKLAVSSEMFIDYLYESVEVDAKDAVCIPQYAEDIFGSQSTSVDSLHDEDFPADKLNIMFAGNVGAAQSVITVVKAASLLRDEPFMFHIVGSGSELDVCKELAVSLELDNIVFHGRHPIEKMPSYYAKADAMLATFANSPVLAYTLPRKIQSYMAAAKPILGTITGAAQDVIVKSGCGLCCAPEDAESLAVLCKEFAQLSPSERADMGMNGKLYYNLHFTRNRFFDKLESELIGLKGMKHGA